MDAHISHSGYWKLKQSVTQLISQAKLDFIRDSNQNRQNQKKSYNRFNRRHHFSIRRLNAVTEAWTLSSPD